MAQAQPRFRVETLGQSKDSDDPGAWVRLGMYVEHYEDAPRALVSTVLLPPELAEAYRRQMALLNDVLDLEEGVAPAVVRPAA
ncbi:hypothetical protein ACIBI0_38670 [Microbispora rosea]|uniref:hypothetical protein n=1 Tax=Microbispora rosea TaxID=58117 RepID=UPI0037AFECB7